MQLTEKGLARMITWNTSSFVKNRYFTREYVTEICELAKKYNFKAINLPTGVFPLAVKLLEGPDIELAAPIGDFSWFNGQNTTEEKAYLTKNAIQNGASEIEFMMNIGAFKDGNYKLVKKDIEGVIEAANGRTVFVIIETPWLEEDEIVKASELAKDGGAHYVKTSKGLGNVAKVSHVKLIRETIGEKMGVKASGGIRTIDDAMKMIDAGANRLGISSAIDIIEDYKKELSRQ